MTDDEVLLDLKTRALPVYGTKFEKLERLKKYYGVNNISNTLINEENSF